MSHRKRNSVQPFRFGGLWISELTPAGLERASVAEVSVPPLESHARARSTRCEKLYVGLEGRVAFTLGERSIELAAGDTLAVPAGTWFAYENRGDAAARMLLVHVPPFDPDAEEFAPADAPGSE